MRASLEAAAFESASSLGNLADAERYHGPISIESDDSDALLSGLQRMILIRVVEEKIGEVAIEACERWPVVRLAVEHRVGHVAVGQASVAVAVSCPHRDEAFAAGRYVIEELKKRAPIWKKEHWPGGGDWVEGA